jgi:hypothetical protein
MRFDPILFWSAVAVVVFLIIVIKLVRDAEIKGAVYPPKHIAVSEMDNHVAQDVYDWVVYSTRMVGPSYLEQLSWRTSKHDFLLSDLCTVLHARSEEERLQRLREIGKSFNLDTSIVDEIFEASSTPPQHPEGPGNRPFSFAYGEHSWTSSTPQSRRIPVLNRNSWSFSMPTSVSVRC